MNKGFTLIELMVSIMIGMLVVGLGAAALNKFNDSQKVITTSQEILSNLRLARSYAISNQLPKDGNRVAVTIGSDGLMIIRPQKLDNNNTDTDDSFWSGDITPKGVGVTFVTPGINDGILRFSVTDGRFISSVVGGTATITVNGDSGTTSIINIDSSGLIYGK